MLHFSGHAEDQCIGRLGAHGGENRGGSSSGWRLWK
jgi:hypothetical protein